jgi:uncharacterized membrane protein YbhN (UPF0104 family)
MAAIDTALTVKQPLAVAPTTAGRGIWVARSKAVAGRIVRWVLPVVAAIMLVRFIRAGWPDIQASLSHLTTDQLPLVGLAVAVEALWVYAMSQVYRSALMAFGGTVPRLAVLRIAMAAFTLSRILPGGGAAGGAVAARELIAAGNPALRTVTSMLSSWWISMTGLSALLVGGIAASVASSVMPARYLIAPAVALTAFLGGGAALVVAARSPRLHARVARAITRGATRLDPDMAVDTSEPVHTNVRITGLLVVFGWGMVVWITDAAALWLALAAFGWQVNIGVLLVAYGVANFIGALPELTPGWLGVIEASVAVTLAAFGVPEGIAAIAVLVYRLVSYWLPTAAGIPAAVSVLGGQRRTLRGTSPARTPKPTS